MSLVRMELTGLVIERKVTTGYDDKSRLADAIIEAIDAIDQTSAGGQLSLRTLVTVRLKHGTLIQWKKEEHG